MTPEEIIAAVSGSLPPAVRCETDHHGVMLRFPAEHWLAALTFARERLDCDFFDWLTGVDEADEGISVVAYVYSLAGRHHVLAGTLLVMHHERPPPRLVVSLLGGFAGILLLLRPSYDSSQWFGVLLALCIRPGHVGTMVWLELIALALIGALLGMALGSAITLYFAHQGISYAGFSSILAQLGLPDRLYPVLSLESVLIGPGAILVSIMIAGLVPYIHVRRLEAASAMRAS